MNKQNLVRTINNKARLCWYDAIRACHIDVGKPEDVMIVAGMGRSGTTWVCDLINYDHRYRVLFEPFFPTRVKAAAGFDYNQYLPQSSRNPLLVRQARQILAGKIRNKWVDLDRHRLIYRGRIIKDIRCNLMLGWLRRIAGKPPLVLVIRHPLQVASSWLKLGSAMEPLGDGSELDLLLNKRPLLADYPIIEEVIHAIPPRNRVEAIVYLWSISHLVPLCQLGEDELYPLFYENLLNNLEDEMARIFQYLNRQLNPQGLQRVLYSPSSTNFLQRDFHQDRTHLLNSWKDEFSQEQIGRADSILDAFGLSHLYDRDGYPTGAPACTRVNSVVPELASS